jgi:hypothetical protein
VGSFRRDAPAGQVVGVEQADTVATKHRSRKKCRLSELVPEKGDSHLLPERRAPTQGWSGCFAEKVTVTFFPACTRNMTLIY